MTRKKVKLGWIVNDSARKASLKKRRASLLKKVRELSTLCGVNACIIIYSPDEVEPAVWPSPPEVQNMLLHFQSLPELERSKKMMDQESYIKDRVARVQAQLRKQQRKNKELETSQIMDQIFQGRMVESLSMREMDGVAWWVDEKKKEIRKRVQFFQQIPPHSPPPPPPQGHGTAVAAAGPESGPRAYFDTGGHDYKLVTMGHTVGLDDGAYRVDTGRLSTVGGLDNGAYRVDTGPNMFLDSGGGHDYKLIESGHSAGTERGLSSASMPGPMVEQLLWDDWFSEMMIPSAENNMMNINIGIGSGVGGSSSFHEQMAAAFPPMQGSTYGSSITAPTASAAAAAPVVMTTDNMGHVPYDVFKSSWPNIFSP
ncbi:uncharacterized protein LOC131145991 [Malania oleifera]|uniref:uncharacterized protein LOC131145991 n=1 Tax=Malania oleifera TaxID=397392 RepID=UPI0025ADFBD2|nr:uncharacterized protein LOC131145991 [Malania oleifera]